MVASWIVPSFGFGARQVSPSRHLAVNVNYGDIEINYLCDRHFDGVVFKFMFLYLVCVPAQDLQMEISWQLNPA